MPENEMGKKSLKDGGGSLIESDFEHMATKWRMTKKEMKQNTFDLLKKQLEEK